MAIRTIRVEEDPCLYKKCRVVEAFDERLSNLIDDMFDTMYDADGVGLAAPQVGILKRVFVVDIGDGRKVELVNPEIIATSGIQGDYEGCLSFPGQHGYVERPDHVVVRGVDRRGNPVTYEGDGLFARAILHENDHLDGLVYLRLRKEPPEEFKKQMELEED